MQRMLTTTKTATLTLLAALALPVALTTAGCKRDDGQTPTSTTTIRSGSPTPEGVRVIDVPLAPSDDPVATPERVAVQLAYALCKHDVDCGEAKLHLSQEARRNAEANCIAGLKAPARLNVDAWECSPAVARAGFEECLAAISQTSCVANVRVDRGLPLACHPAQVCKRGEGITSR